MLTYEAIRDIVDIVVPNSTFNTVELEPEFAKKVRSTSVILKSNSPISYEDIRRVAGDTYYTIALRIATARFENNKSSFQWNEDDILAMMTPRGAGASLSPITRLGAFSGGIESAAARLTAATLSKNIPLNNSSLKFVDAAKELELQALEDVERIIKLISSAANTSTTSINEIVKGQAYLYIAHDIDKTTLPETSFNTPDNLTINPPTFDEAVFVKNVEVVNTFSVPPNKVGICYFYMTGQLHYADQDLINNRIYSNGEGAPQTSNSVSYKIEKVFKVLGHNDIFNIDDLITALSDNINSETLEVSTGAITNILTAANRGENKIINDSILKRDLYPLTTSLKNRKATCEIYTRINKLTFDVRRYSNKASTELLTIAFHTIDEVSPINNQPYFSTTNEITPGFNILDFKLAIKQGSLGIEGLIFGTINSYSSLNNNVPYSALLNVEKGNVSAVSISGENSGGGTNPADNLANSDASNVIDTFYFAYNPDNAAIALNPLLLLNPFTEDLIIRVSTTSYSSAIPLDIIVDLTTVPFLNSSLPNSLSIGEQVAERVVDAIYEYTRNSSLNNDTKDNANILGVLLGDFQRITTIINSTLGTATEVPLEEFIDGVQQTRFNSINETEPSYLEPPTPNFNNPKRLDEVAGRVQIVAFRYRDEEYKIVVELKSVPDELWIGTGNYILRRTQWAKGKRRSITADTKILSSGSITVPTSAEELNSVKASVSNIEASKSKLLQSVFDKRNFLKDAQKGFPNKWYNQT
jgi:hypothetical protein